MVGTARGAELGVLFRDGVALETASRIRIACLDKTGTLTAGTPTIAGEPDSELLRLAASVEQAAAADLGVAIGSGTDLAVATSDVTLLRDGIAALPTALALARATLRVIRRNLVAASAYNLVCIPIAAMGLLSPVVASAAMSLSSVSVLLSSLALRRFVVIKE